MPASAAMPIGATYLVSCVKTKRATAARAHDLYTSDWFTSARAFVEARSARWFILSAKYGLLDPNATVDPYEKTLKQQPIAQRRQWAADVATSLLSRVPPPASVVMLAGDAYAEFLIHMLRASGLEIIRPMTGLRQGEQLRWLKQNR